MNGYQRFISYVYEYRRGKKEENCGFIKVEERNGKCIIDVRIRCRGLAADQETKLYGFIRRNKELQGILLGVLMTEEDELYGIIETDADNLHGSKVPLHALGGMILTLESGGFYGTEWDDFPIQPEYFLEVQSEAGMVSEPIVSEEERGLLQETFSMEDEAEEKMDSSDIQEEAIPVLEVKETDELINGENEKQISESVMMDKTIQKDTVQENENSKKIEDRIKDEMKIEAAEVTKQDRELQEKESIPKFDPFEDGEIQECRKITPQYIVQCNRRDWALRNNRFLLYGFYHFGHLLLGKLRDGQYIIGVPGMYDQQERYLANMFGFPHFKESVKISIPKAKGGYWYRLIYPPNGNKGNSLF